MSDDDSITIGPEGGVSVGPKAASFLSRKAGKWRLQPGPDELLVFERVGVAGAAGQVTFSGRISAPGELVDTIQMISNGRWEGVLRVRTDELRKTLFFLDGEVVGAVSSDPKDRIGEILVRQGLVSESLLHAALEMARNKPLGAVLIQQGLVSHHQLYSSLKLQVEEIFVSLMVIAEGSYFFLKGPLPTAVAQRRLRLPVAALLLEGGQRMDEMRFFREKIPSLRVVLEKAGLRTKITLDGDERAVHQLVDGMRPLEEVAHLVGLNELEATRVAFRLLTAGIFRVVSTEPLGKSGAAARLAGPAEVADAINEVLRKVYAEAKGANREEALKSAPIGFYVAPTDHAELFNGVEWEEDGTLTRQRLLDNAESGRDEEQEPAEFLHDGLAEFLSYVVFVLCEELPGPEQAALRDRLENLIREGGVDLD